MKAIVYTEYGPLEVFQLKKVEKLYPMANEELVFLKELIEIKKMVAATDKPFPLVRMADTHRCIDQSYKKGKVVISVVHNSDWHLGPYKLPFIVRHAQEFAQARMAKVDEVDAILPIFVIKPGDWMMEGTRIILSGLWVAVMLTYLWGDVLTIFAGDFKPGEMQGMKVTKRMWFGIGILMLIPILMLVLTLTLPHPAIRWANIVVAIFWIIFNLVSISGYPAYNKFLLSVSVVFNIMTIWYAWNWVAWLWFLLEAWV